jgi:uridine kinase
LRKYQDVQKPCFLILIGGCSRTGKSTLATELKNKFKSNSINSIIIKLDNWLLGIDERIGIEIVRERYNYSEIIKSMKYVLKGEKMYPPIYDPKTRAVSRENLSEYIQIEKGICIIEGVIALDIPELRTLSDIKIYTEVEDEIRKKRLMEFYCQFKECSAQESKEIINEREVEEVPYIKETEAFADIIYHGKS